MSKRSKGEMEPMPGLTPDGGAAPAPAEGPAPVSSPSALSSGSKSTGQAPAQSLAPAKAGAGAAKPALATVATPDTKEWTPRNEREFVDYFMYLLQAPIVGHPDWVDTLRDQNHEVTLQRLIHANEIFAAKMCTEFEAMLCISTHTLVAPVSHDWYVVYAWLFRRWKPEAAAQIFTDHDGETLNINQKEDLAQLRRWVFKKQMLHLKQKHSGVSQETVERERKELEVEQPRML